MKPLVWVGSSRDDVRGFPVGARKETGYQLLRVQEGLDPTDWKPLKAVGPGVREIRIQGETAHRVLYVARFEEAVYVLHAFTKKARATPRRDIDVAKARLAALTAARRRRS